MRKSSPPPNGKAHEKMLCIALAALLLVPLTVCTVPAQSLNNTTLGASADENKTSTEALVLDAGTLTFGSAQDTVGTISTTNKVTLSGGEIRVNGSGTKISGALQMKPENDKIPLVKPGTQNTFVPDTNPALVPPVHSITAGAAGMDVNGTHINIGAPRYAAGAAPLPADIAKSWEGLRLDLKTSNGGDMRIGSGDFRVANIVFPIKNEGKAALRFDSAGSLMVSGGQFTMEGQPLGNPARGNYDAPSLLTLKAQKDVLINGGTYDIRSARMHLVSTEGTVYVNNGTFNINSSSPYPGWQTFDKAGQTVTERPQNGNTQDKLNVFGSLDTSSKFVVNGGTFNLGTPTDTTANYINLANNTAIFNGGTFNVYNGSNFGNNKADLIINGGTYNLVTGGYLGGRNFSGNAVDIRGGTYNFEGGSGIFGYSIGLATEAAYLNDEKYNKTALRISGGTFNYTSANPARLEKVGIQSSYQVDIAGGEFVRKSDGLNAITASFVSTGQSGSAADTSGNLNISGGHFYTQNPSKYTEGVVITRDDNIRLYNPNSGVAGVYSLYTEAEINTIFAQGDAAITAAFAPAKNPTALPNKEDVLKALKAVQNMAIANIQEAWHFEAARNINITGGNFDLHTVNASSFKALGTFNWQNARLISAGGGGMLTISGKDGINILSGSIRSLGSTENGADALKYDDRGKLDRDRWTLGKYMTFATDGDMTVGAKGSKIGPEIYFSDGMLFFTGVNQNAAAGNLYLHSGSITLDGQYRSTLNTGNMNNIIDGGTLNILTADRINRNKIDSASMWTMPVTLKSGTINLYNSQLGGKLIMDGGVINAMGDSAINNGFVGQTIFDTTINGGVINLGPKAYLGAIKGDSKALSPYVTASGSITVGDKAHINMAVAQPADSTLVVGKHIGGIYTTEANANISIANGTRFEISNPTVLNAGTYTATSIIESKSGLLSMSDKITDMLFYNLNMHKTTDNTANMVLTVKNPQSVIAGLPGSANVRDNSFAYADLLRNASGPWRDFAATVTSSSAAEASELLRQVGGENTTATANNLVSSMGEFRNRMRAWSKSSVSGVSAGDSVPLQNDNRAWISGMGNWTNQGSTDGRTGYDASSGGVVAGFEHIFAQHYTVGLALGYARGFSQSKDNRSEADSDTWFGSLYTSLDFQPIVIDADISYANTQTRITNSFALPGNTVENTGEFGTNAWSFGLKGSYVYTFNNNATKLAPYVGIEFLSISQNSYSEDGPMARSFAGDYSTLWTLPVGIKASHEFKGETWSFTPEVGVAYARDLNEFKPAARVSVPGMNSEIKSYGPQLSPDSLRANVGFTAKYSDNLEFFATYNVDARSNYTNQGVNAGFAFNF